MRSVVAWALASAALLAVGCGGGGTKKSSTAGNPGGTHYISTRRAASAQEAREIRTTLTKLEEAVTAHDAATVCNRLFTPVAVVVEQGGGRTCEQSVAKEMKENPPSRLHVNRITVRREHRCLSSRVPSSKGGGQCADVDKAFVVLTSSASGRKPFQTVGTLYNEQGAWLIDDTVADYLLPPPPNKPAPTGVGGEPGNY